MYPEFLSKLCSEKNIVENKIPGLPNAFGWKHGLGLALAVAVAEAVHPVCVLRARICIFEV